LAFFFVLAGLIVVADQIAKVWVLASFEPYRVYPVADDWIRIHFIHNAGGLFGMLQGSAPILAAVTVAVVIILVVVEIHWGWQSWPMTLALTLLLGGAIGNFIDRIRLGYVVDFVDIGIGSWRWYIFNVADSAVTGFFLLLVAMWLLPPHLILLGRREAPKGAARAGTEEPVGR
jgi:signal peptidase II